jgi:hypothetical protein
MGGFDEQKFVGENWANNEQVKNGYAEMGEAIFIIRAF